MERFPFLKEKGHVISIVGAGGKTTLLYALAKRFKENGARTIVTTTTHIFRPDGDLWARNANEVKCLWNRGSYAVVGQLAENGKLRSLSKQELNAYVEMADVVLIEADGAKQLPCKVPAAHEPVLLEASDIVIGVMGMDAYGRSIKEVCFRKEETARLLHADEMDLLTAERMAAILASEKGTRKNVGNREYYVVLNKCESEERIQAAEKIRELLQKQQIYRCILTSYGEEKEELNIFSQSHRIF